MAQLSSAKPMPMEEKIKIRNVKGGNNSLGEHFKIRFLSHKQIVNFPRGKLVP